MSSFIRLFNHSFISFIHSLTHSLTHSLIHSLRDCEQAENWMTNRESFLQQGGQEDSKEEKIEMMIKKHEDFDKVEIGQAYSTKVIFTVKNSSLSFEFLLVFRIQIRTFWLPDSAKKTYIKYRGKSRFFVVKISRFFICF